MDIILYPFVLEDLNLTNKYESISNLFFNLLILISYVNLFLFNQKYFFNLLNKLKKNLIILSNIY